MFPRTVGGDLIASASLRGPLFLSPSWVPLPSLHCPRLLSFPSSRFKNSARRCSPPPRLSPGSLSWGLKSALRVDAAASSPLTCEHFPPKLLRLPQRGAAVGAVATLLYMVSDPEGRAMAGICPRGTSTLLWRAPTLSVHTPPSAFVSVAVLFLLALFFGVFIRCTRLLKQGQFIRGGKHFEIRLTLKSQGRSGVVTHVS